MRLRQVDSLANGLESCVRFLPAMAFAPLREFSAKIPANCIRLEPRLAVLTVVAGSARLPIRTVNEEA